MALMYKSIKHESNVSIFVHTVIGSPQLAHIKPRKVSLPLRLYECQVYHNTKAGASILKSISQKNHTLICFIPNVNPPPDLPAG